MQDGFTNVQEYTSMNFHNFYKYFILVCGVITFFSSLFSEDATGGVIPAIYSIVTGVLLIMNLTAGRIMTKISNIIGIISSSFMVLGGIIFMVAGGTAMGGFMSSSSELYAAGAGLFGGLVIIIALALVIGGAINIVLNSLILKYYNKRKHMFK